MRCACVDIGSNTTRLVVAEHRAGVWREVLVHRRFLPLGAAGGDTIEPEEIAALAETVAGQLAAAHAEGCVEVRVVATAAIRAAANRAELCAAVTERCGATIDVLSEGEEAALAFAGATAGRAGSEPVAVLDVGGGSSELVVGSPAAGVTWWASVPVGSGVLTRRHVRGDPPAPAELDAVAADVAAALADVGAPRPALALAVGGSALSLRRVAGEVLTPAAIADALATLAELPAEVAALHFGVDVERARLMPAGLLLLQGVRDVLGAPELRLADGGLREGVLLRELARHR